MRRGWLWALAAASVALLVAVLGWRLASRRDGGPDRARALIGAVEIEYPVSYARFGAGRAGGRLGRLELAFAFPGLQGAGAAASALPADDAQHAAGALVFLTLRSPDDVDPADRVGALYARFLQSDVWREENGLIMRRFEAASPYDHEELHFVPPDGRLFAARCVRPMQPPSDLPSTCLATLRLDGMDVDLRFPPVLLPQWDALTDGTRRLVASFTPK